MHQFYRCNAHVNKNVYSFLCQHYAHLLLRTLLLPGAAVVLAMQQSIDISYLLGSQ